MDFLDPQKQRAHMIRLYVGYFLIGALILMATIILLYWAYGFGLGKDGKVIQNGLVFVSSQPGGADVYVDGKKSKRRSRWAAALSFGMGLFLIAGVIAYMNAPALSMRLAASRAGFDAKLPGYSPVGFKFGSLSYGPGNVTVSYTAGEDSDRKFDITQKASDWDSQALLSNFVASANKAYQTYERAGRTIYFYGNNTATWVDSGVWYTVNGNNSLSKNQLLDMAGSL